MNDKNTLLNGFTFWASYYNAIKRFPEATDRAALYDALSDYAFYGIVPDFADFDEIKKIAFTAIWAAWLPSIEKSIKRGQTKKPTENQTETKPKPNQNQMKSKRHTGTDTGTGTQRGRGGVFSADTTTAQTTPDRPFTQIERDLIDTVTHRRYDFDNYHKKRSDDLQPLF